MSDAIKMTTEKQSEQVEAAVLAELERLRTELLANISKESRVPPALPSGLASMLLQSKRPCSAGEHRKLFRLVDQEINRLKHLTLNPP